MATLSQSLLHRLHSLSSSSSSSSSTCTSLLFHCSLHHLPGQVVPTLPEIPILSTASYFSTSKLQFIHHPTKLFLHPLLFLSSSFDGPLDTQTFLATISVLAAIALSLFLGLKATSLLFSYCALEILFLVGGVLAMSLRLKISEDKKKEKKKKIKSRIDTLQEVWRFWIFKAPLSYACRFCIAMSMPCFGPEDDFIKANSFH
ncbi:hypothetical protein TEA_001282 [Camellia sinensis var. sinensis]|uniref:Uncharacterized protein n=1 Tax=Camellia sinensis var. sinensis TaxID=542762 RepID=A0A4S4EUW3_CAMSN|nr:hypothetical protein TEA_001282 [Camellia sinensis var. sinensis]